MNKQKEIQSQFNELSKLLDKYENFGAGDSEPTHAIFDALKDAYNGKTNIPSNEDWQLFEDVEGVKEIYPILNKQLEIIINSIKSLTLEEANKLKFQFSCYNINKSEFDY